MGGLPVVQFPETQLLDNKNEMAAKGDVPVGQRRLILIESADRGQAGRD
jgi:hypothetical protein